MGVVLLHVCERWNLHHYPNHLYLAVPFFFTLSGYVIARSYEIRLRAGMSLIRFTGIRLIRLYPMLALSLVIAGCLRASWHEVVLGLLFLPSFTNEILYPGNGPQWSLFLEIVGNLVHATCIRWLTDRVIMLAVLISGLGTAYTAVYYGNLEIGWGIKNLWGGVLLFGFCYGTGILIHRFEQREMLPTRSVSLLLLISLYIVAAGVPQSRYSLLSASRDMLCAAVIFPAIIVFAIRSSLPTWLDGTSKLSGEISYPLYIVHHPIVFALAPLVVSVGLSEFITKLVGLATVFACTMIAYVLLRWIDIPIRRRLSSLLHAKPQQLAAGSA